MNTQLYLEKLKCPTSLILARLLSICGTPYPLDTIPEYHL